MNKTTICMWLIVSFSCMLPAQKPNILWICIEDASPHIGCYGETAISTPTLDSLAKDGVLFKRAFVTAPVCSSSRSAMVTGMYQTTSGFMHHRSQRSRGKGSTTKAYTDSYKLPADIKAISKLFKEQGYYTSNAKKTDYNFVANGLYDSTKGWDDRPKGQPFFAQIQLTGGKDRRSAAGVDLSKMTIPPYYADCEIIRNDWARYLGSWVKVDAKVKTILSKLRDDGDLENTYIFLWTDHGVSHIRGKQFLYDEGLHIPLLVRFPKKQNASLIREDLVSHIDIPVTSLALAGIAIPESMQGKSLFKENYQEQQFIVSARDRCDETVDIIRSIRTKRFKYIRNFLPDCSHMQRSQYKEGKKIIQESKRLFQSGELTPLQATFFKATRPIEELYDLESDPNETKNLAADPELKDRLITFRQQLQKWMINSRDCGLIPEPILEDLGQKFGSKFAVLKDDSNKNLVKDLLQVIEAGEKKDAAALSTALKSPRAAIRYWAVKALGNQKMKSFITNAEQLLKDESATVRLAAAESLIQLGAELAKPLELICSEAKNKNALVGMYAMRSLEAIGIQAKPYAAEAIKEALNSRYEFTMRVAKRLIKEWQL